MSAPTKSRFGGIHASVLIPLEDDFGISEEQLATHVAATATVVGINGLLVNGHAGENFLLGGEEKRRVVEIARATVPKGKIIVSGVNAESSIEAAEQARDAEKAGADALLIFPPYSWALHHETEAVVLHHKLIEAATGLPLFLFQASVSAGRMGYDLQTLEKLIDLQSVIGIKEGSWEVAAYEEHLRFVKTRRPEILVLGSGDEHLLASYLVGSDGSQVSLAAVVPELICKLWAAASSENWCLARDLHERLYPLATAVYRQEPAGRATARLKTCLVALGAFRSDRVRPPCGRTPSDEAQRLTEALGIAMSEADAQVDRAPRRKRNPNGGHGDELVEKNPAP